MPTRSPTFREKLTSWEVLSSNLAANIASFPDLHNRQTAFAALIAEGLSMVAQQEEAEALASSLVERRKELERQGNHAREFLVAGLRAGLGVANPLLLGYGIRPRYSRRRPSPEPTQPPMEKPSASESAPPSPSPSIITEPQVH